GAEDQVLVTEVDEGERALLVRGHVRGGVPLGEQRGLLRGRRLQRFSLGGSLYLDRLEVHVLAGVGGLVEGQRRGARVHIGAGGVNVVQVGKGAEPAQGGRERPPLGGAVRAVLRA